MIERVIQIFLFSPRSPMNGVRSIFLACLALFVAASVITAFSAISKEYLFVVLGAIAIVFSTPISVCLGYSLASE